MGWIPAHLRTRLLSRWHSIPIWVCYAIVFCIGLLIGAKS